MPIPVHSIQPGIRVMTSALISPARLYRLGGNQGSPVLLIHGFGSDRFSWAATALRLVGRHRVWAVELPGHGDAENNVGEGTPQALAGAVAAAVAELPRPFSVVGHSLGGTTALHLKQLLGDDLSHLAVIAPGGWGTVIDHSFVLALPELQTPEEAEKLLHRLVKRERLIKLQMVKHVLEMLERPGRRDALRAIARGILSVPPPPEPIATEMLVIWGAQDGINTPDHMRLQALGDRALVLNDVGHMPHVEAQSAVNNALIAFLPR